MKRLLKREFRKCTYLPKTNKNEDTHIVSELLTYDDESTERNFNVIENYKRPYFVTKKIYRKRHKQKQEYEDVKYLERIDCTESEAVKKLAFKLGERGRPNMRKLKSSPYLYNADLKASTIIKKIYNSKLNGDFTPYSVCMLDIEAHVLTSEISLITISLDDKSFTYVNKTWMDDKDEDKFKEKVYKIYEEEAPDIKSVSKDGLVTTTDGSTYTLDIIFCRDEGKVIQQCMSKVHALKPDILTAWNALYDIDTMSQRARDVWRIDPADLFSDPSIPKHLRHFSIKRDDGDYKKMNSGKESFVPFHARWHVFNTSSYFTILDNMAAFFFIRNGSEPQVAGGYSLDNILDNYVNFNKLKPRIPGLDFLGKKEWNEVMSRKHKAEYCAYNIFDSKSMIFLDNKTNDLTINLPLLLQDSEIDIFKSGPKRLLDSYSFFLLDKGKVVSTKSPLAQKTEGLGTEDWIVTLDAWKKGYKNTFKPWVSLDTVRSNLRLLTTDLDIISSYPFQTLMFGLGTKRTSRELIDVEGFEKSYFVKQNLGICTGKVHALGFGSKMLNLPTVYELDEYIKNKKVA